MKVRKPVRILGVGNVLMGDDGFGPYVARTLGARYELPEHVEVQDVGTPGLDFTPYLDGTGVIHDVREWGVEKHTVTAGEVAVMPKCLRTSMMPTPRSSR